MFFSAGGLVTAVAPVVINGNGVWVGWPGMHMDNPNEPIPESDPNDKTPTAGLLSSKVSNGETICPRGLYFVGKFIRTEFNELKFVRNFRR